MIKETIAIWLTKEKRTYHLSDSSGNQADISNAEQLFNFLLIDADKPFTCKMVWNLYEIWGIMKSLLPSSFMDELDKKDRAFYNDYKVFSSSGKVLSIGYKPHIRDNFYGKRLEINVYNLRQYFPEENPTNLNELNYLSGLLMNELHNLNWETDSLSSAISIYDHAVLNKEFIPSVYDMPDEDETDGMLSYCYQLMGREWRSTFKVGHFQNAVDVDVRSGYPSFIKDFGNTSECKIVHSNKLIASDFGVCKGILHINKDFHPIVNRNGQNVVGSYEDYITTEQWGYLVHYGIGSFDMEDGYFLTFENPDDKPFEKLMTDLYGMRERGGLFKTLAKNISVGVYGYQSQEYEEKYGKYFNPIYSVMTTSKCAIKVGKLIEEKLLKDSLISVTVDGLLLTSDIEINTENIIGGWKKDTVNALVLSIGHSYLADKKDSFQNTYSTMIEAIKSKPSKQIYNSVLINQNLMNTNRTFKKFPRIGKDLLDNIYNSEPIHV